MQGGFDPKALRTVDVVQLDLFDLFPPGSGGLQKLEKKFGKQIKKPLEETKNNNSTSNAVKKPVNLRGQGKCSGLAANKLSKQ